MGPPPPPPRTLSTNMRAQPRRGEIRYNTTAHYADQQQQYRSNQYSSQDSLPDSPYSSQSLDSHTSQGLGTYGTGTYVPTACSETRSGLKGQ